MPVPDEEVACARALEVAREAEGEAASPPSPRRDGGEAERRVRAELQPLLAAAFFVECDDDGNGAVDRREFVETLWMLTRATAADRAMSLE